jgi:hypothetical protein
LGVARRGMAVMWSEVRYNLRRKEEANAPNGR